MTEAGGARPEVGGVAVEQADAPQLGDSVERAQQVCAGRHTDGRRRRNLSQRQEEKTQFVSATGGEAAICLSGRRPSKASLRISRGGERPVPCCSCSVCA